MKSHTEYLWFNTKKHREFINITGDVGADAAGSGFGLAVTVGRVLAASVAVAVAQAKTAGGCQPIG